jgi:putative transposase
MPSHIHMILRLHPSHGSISGIIRDIKKYSAWDIMDAIRCDGNIQFTELFSQAAVGHAGQDRKFWMPRFDDQVIRSRDMMITKLEYIHANPVRAGLVSDPVDYKYSSARNYFLGDQSVLEVDIDGL